MKENIEKSKEGFESFISEIPFLLKILQELLLKSGNYKNVRVDFAHNSVNKIEQFYIDILKNKESISIPHNFFDKIMIAYYGEAFIHHAGGNWQFNNNKDDIVYATPIILNWGKESENMQISPVMMIEGIKRSLTGGMWEAIEYASNFEEMNNKLMEEMKNLGKKKKGNKK